MVSITARSGALKNIGASLDSTKPVVMVNLLRFKEQAQYDDGTTCTGREAYTTYSKHTIGLVQNVGGEVVYHGKVHGSMIAPEGEEWDLVLLVRYPNFAAFIEMVSSSAYQAIAHHRTVALNDSRLIATQEH